VSKKNLKQKTFNENKAGKKKSKKRNQELFSNMVNPVLRRKWLCEQGQ